MLSTDTRSLRLSKALGQPIQILRQQTIPQTHLPTPPKSRRSLNTIINRKDPTRHPPFPNAYSIARTTIKPTSPHHHHHHPGPPAQQPPQSGPSSASTPPSSPYGNTPFTNPHNPTVPTTVTTRTKSPPPSSQTTPPSPTPTSARDAPGPASPPPSRTKTPYTSPSTCSP